MAQEKKQATIYDVAYRAHTSLATASRVINGKDNVAEPTRQKVLKAIKELNYKPNAMAKGLAMQKNTNVAIIVPEINYTYISHVVAGLMDCAKKYGYDCLIFTTENRADVNKVLNKVLSLRVNGVIVFNDYLDEKDVGVLTDFEIPTVTIGLDLKTKSSVTWHYKNQIKEIVDNCLNNKHKEVFFLKVKNSGKMEQRLLNAVIETYHEHQKEFKNIIEVPDSYKETYPIMRRHFLKHKQGFYIALRDSIAIAALNAAMDLKKDVPNDVEIMAMIGTKYSELTRPKLSSFDIDMRGLGYESMEVLTKLIQSDKKIISKKLPFAFIQRGTTK